MARGGARSGGETSPFRGSRRATRDDDRPARRDSVDHDGRESRPTLVKINLKIICMSALLAVAPFNVGTVGFCLRFAAASATLKDDNFSDDVFQVNFVQGGSQVHVSHADRKA